MGNYPLVICYIAIEHGTWLVRWFSCYLDGDFPVRYVNVYQSVWYGGFRFYRGTPNDPKLDHFSIIVLKPMVTWGTPMTSETSMTSNHQKDQNDRLMTFRIFLLVALFAVSRGNTRGKPRWFAITFFMHALAMRTTKCQSCQSIWMSRTSPSSGDHGDQPKGSKGGGFLRLEWFFFVKLPKCQATDDHFGMVGTHRWGVPDGNVFP